MLPGSSVLIWYGSIEHHFKINAAVASRHSTLYYEYVISRGGVTLTIRRQADSRCPTNLRLLPEEYSASSVI